MKKIITILVVLFIFSCKKGSDTKPSLQSYNRYGNVDPKNKKMGYEAINTVDTLLYNKVSSMYSLSRNREELFFFANMMALKHNY